MRHSSTVFSVLLLLLLLLASGSAMGGASDDPGAVGREALVSWNARLFATAEDEDGLLTLKGVRAAAMMHLAMHDALNTIERRYESYALHARHVEADPLVALVQAAYEIALSQYPTRKEQWIVERSRWLDGVADGPRKARAIELGKAAAMATIRAREDDGWNREASYHWHPKGPGVYAEFHEHSGTPQGFIFGAGWARARPFMLRSPDQFRVPAPPAITSAAYARAFNEVKRVGRYQSKVRTADQSHLALWWKEFAEKSHNRLARELIVSDKTGLWASARLFALVNMDIFDGYVSVFDNKFHYNHWRPYTAIRSAARDGNPETLDDPEWNNLHRHTYAFPSYPSAHGTVCAAAMTAFADTYGDAHPFTLETPSVDSAGPMSGKMAMAPPARSFERFSEAAMECALSRVYLGIHFRYDSIEGNRLGVKIGTYALQHFLTARP